MAQPFLAEIKIVGFDFAPSGWALCDGQLLPISQNQALFSLMGTTYGGNGTTNFALPDLRGRTPIHFGSSDGQNHVQASKGGEEAHSLTTAEIPAHTHQLHASNDTGDQQLPAGRLWARSPATDPQWGSPATTVDMAPSQNSGGGQAHENMQPFLALTFCISLQGQFPPQN